MVVAGRSPSERLLGIRPGQAVIEPQPLTAEQVARPLRQLGRTPSENGTTVWVPLPTRTIPQPLPPPGYAAVPPGHAVVMQQQQPGLNQPMYAAGHAMMQQPGLNQPMYAAGNMMMQQQPAQPLHEQQPTPFGHHHAAVPHEDVYYYSESDFSHQPGPAHAPPPAPPMQEDVFYYSESDFFNPAAPSNQQHVMVQQWPVGAPQPAAPLQGHMQLPPPMQGGWPAGQVPRPTLTPEQLAGLARLVQMQGQRVQHGAHAATASGV